MTIWSRTFFPGAVELVERIPSRYLRATLCNSNSIQWPYLMQNERFAKAFVHHFASQWNPYHWMFIIGALLTGVVMFASGGILGISETLMRWLSRRWRKS